VAVDAAGNVGNSAVVTVLVDNGDGGGGGGCGCTSTSADASLLLALLALGRYAALRPSRRRRHGGVVA